MSLRIDAHHHLWKIARGDYGWLTQKSVPTIYRDFLAADLEPLLHEARIDKTILVQAAESIAETEFLLSLAKQSPFIAGVVGWVDFGSPHASRDIERLARDEKLVGLRPMLQDMADARWILRPECNAALACMQQMKLRFDALVRPRHLSILRELVEQHPTLAVVIDHGAKPFIASGEIDPWRRDMRALASAAPNLHCKLSGLATEAGSTWDAGKLQPYVEVLLECFGPSRLMWGSDWPVLLLAGSYVEWLRVAEALTTSLSSSERELVFGGTAAKFYGVLDA